MRLIQEVTKKHLYHLLVVSDYYNLEREAPGTSVKHLYRSSCVTNISYWFCDSFQKFRGHRKRPENFENLIVPGKTIAHKTRYFVIFIRFAKIIMFIMKYFFFRDPFTTKNSKHFNQFCSVGVSKFQWIYKFIQVRICVGAI